MHSNSSDKEFIVVSEQSYINEELAVKLTPAQNNNCACNDCPHMKLNTMEKIYLCMKYQVPEVIIPNA